jgi:hypothetical protein
MDSPASAGIRSLPVRTRSNSVCIIAALCGNGKISAPARSWLIRNGMFEPLCWNVVLFKSVNASAEDLIAIARHVTGCHLNQETSV